MFHSLMLSLENCVCIIFVHGSDFVFVLNCFEEVLYPGLLGMLQCCTFETCHCPLSECTFYPLSISVSLTSQFLITRVFFFHCFSNVSPTLQCRGSRWTPSSPSSWLIYLSLVSFVVYCEDYHLINYFYDHINYIFAPFRTWQWLFKAYQMRSKFSNPALNEWHTELN